MPITSLKNKKEYILDTMVMEGLAERTVDKYLGSEILAHWTKIISEVQTLSDFGASI